MIGQTTYLNEESERKQVSMPYWAYHALKRGAAPSMTKGLVAYEALLLTHDKYSDSLTDVESLVDDVFAREVGTRSLDAINKIKFADKADCVD